MTTSLFTEILDEDHQVRPHWLTDPSRVVVPIATDTLEVDEWLECVQRLLKTSTARRIMAKCFVEFSERESEFECENSDAAIRELEYGLLPFKHALPGDNGSALTVLIEPEGVGLLGGSVSAVENALKDTVCHARNLFREWATKFGEDTRQYQYYLGIARRYQSQL